MKSQTAAEVVARRRSRAHGWRPPRGELKLIAVVDEETGGRWGAQWLTEQQPDEARVDWLAQRGRRRRRCPYGDRRLYGVCCAEKGTFRFRVRARGVAGHASVPGHRRQRAAQARARAHAARRAAAPTSTSSTEAARCSTALGEDPDDPRGAVASVRADEPRLAALVEPTLCVTARADPDLRVEKINVIPAKAELLGRLPRAAGHGR